MPPIDRLPFRTVSKKENRNATENPPCCACTPCAGIYLSQASARIVRGQDHEVSAKCPRTPGYAAITGLATIARNEVDRGLFSGAHKTGFSACAEPRFVRCGKQTSTDFVVCAMVARPVIAAWPGVRGHSADTSWSCPPTMRTVALSDLGLKDLRWGLKRHVLLVFLRGTIVAAFCGDLKPSRLRGRPCSK